MVIVGTTLWGQRAYHRMLVRGFGVSFSPQEVLKGALWEGLGVGCVVGVRQGMREGMVLLDGRLHACLQAE